MGNKTSKSRSSRGQALGSSTGSATGSSQQNARKTPQQIQAEQRAARGKLVQRKKKHIQAELSKKEKMLHIVDAAHAVKHGEKVPDLPKSMQYEKPAASSPGIVGPLASVVTSPKADISEASPYMASPASRQALAAEQRIQQKQKKSKNMEERKNRTLDLMFGDGLKIKASGTDSQQCGSSSLNTSIVGGASAAPNRSESVPVNSGSKAANAALSRFGQQKSAKAVHSKDRKARTAQLVHGDLLRSKDEAKAAPRAPEMAEGIDADIAAVDQSILNLNNCNPHEKMPVTAKLLRKVITNVLGAETKEDQEKFGKLRLSNKKIKSALVDMEYGIETLAALGFVRKKVYNDKEHKMDDYLVFDFDNTNHKALCYVMDKLNEYYPDT